MAEASHEGWKVVVSQEWDVLGPFPIHAREQHFLSPSFPLDLSKPIDFNATHPSAYADSGLVGWSKAHSREDGTLEVSFPNIRWESLRATEGWAALQHHSVLRSTLAVYPPAQPNSRTKSPPRLRVNLVQGSFFTVVPTRTPASLLSQEPVPEWHAGNIYDMGRSPSNLVTLPVSPSLSEPTSYDIIVSGDYEIRLFGDPRHDGSNVPKLSINLTVDIEEPLLSITRSPSHDVYSDFVDGWAFGDALGVGLYSVDGWWTVKSAAVSEELAGDIELDVVQQTRLAPGQHRIIPIKLTQTRPVGVEQLKFTLEVSSAKITSSVEIVIPVQNRVHWTTIKDEPYSIKATYFFAASTPTAFIVAPPDEPNAGLPQPPILALHGAGVDIFAHDFWIQAIPRQRRSWIITPTGRTAWGLDWHGPSAQDAWSTVDALYEILNARTEWRPWTMIPNTRVLLMGHSNGGQGAWYIAAKYPDRIVGAVPAAGYIKSQSYVPWVQSRAAHYIDPALRAILDSSLTPDDNDLFLSNLADTPVLAIHGGDDDNVPVWHTREAVSILKTWNPNANVTFREDPGELHWYPSLFNNHQVQSFVSSLLEQSNSKDTPTSKSFTLTVAIPADSGSLHGWSIHSLRVPGRLARLTVVIQEGAVEVRTTNVKGFSIRIGSLPIHARNVPFIFDGQRVELDEGTWKLDDFTLAVSQESGQWTPYSPREISELAPRGRATSILNSVGPLTIVIATKREGPELSAALRLAHNLNVYHKLDAEILDDQEALHRLRQSSLDPGNVVVLEHGPLGEFAKSILGESKTAFCAQGSTLELRGRSLNEPSTAALFLHPHPLHSSSSVFFVYGSDLTGLERGLRLFPIRTGITVPDWIVVGPQADERGAGGVEGAGVWGNDWGWNEAMSAF
ncbi:hypothetical protein C2E23DRAFT_719844 [Lenzites betulinus]|nr:hypothetical protein C2E23DRAFT_719844 [Lenzites betulinus]